MRKLTWCSLVLSLIAAPAMANTAGYYVVLDGNAEGPSDIGFVGESTTLAGRYGTFGNFNGVAYAVLYDFNGDGIPEVVTSSDNSPTVDVQDFLTGDMLAQGHGATSGRGGTVPADCRERGASGAQGQ